MTFHHCSAISRIQQAYHGVVPAKHLAESAGPDLLGKNAHWMFDGGLWLVLKDGRVALAVTSFGFSVVWDKRFSDLKRDHRP